MPKFNCMYHIIFYGEKVIDAENKEKAKEEIESFMSTSKLSNGRLMDCDEVKCYNIIKIRDRG